MIGTWLGYYKFDDARIQDAIGFEKTFFTVQIKSFDENNFKGVVIDDIKSGGMEGMGEIIGKIKGENISFKKLMPKEGLIYPNGEQKYTEKKHATLYYEGIFSEDKKEIMGKWKFKIRIVFLFGFIPIPYRPGKGTWSMRIQ